MNRFLRELGGETPRFVFIGYRVDTDKNKTILRFRCKNCGKEVEKPIVYDKHRLLNCDCSKSFEVIVPTSYDKENKEVTSFSIVSEAYYKKLIKLNKDKDTFYDCIVEAVKKESSRNIMAYKGRM